MNCKDVWYKVSRCGSAVGWRLQSDGGWVQIRADPRAFQLKFFNNKHLSHWQSRAIFCQIVPTLSAFRAKKDLKIPLFAAVSLYERFMAFCSPNFLFWRRWSFLCILPLVSTWRDSIWTVSVSGVLFWRAWTLGVVRTWHGFLYSVISYETSELGNLRIGF